MKWFNSSKKGKNKNISENNLSKVEEKKLTRKEKKLQKAETKRLNKENKKINKQNKKANKKKTNNVVIDQQLNVVDTNAAFFENNNFQDFYIENNDINNSLVETAIDNAIYVAEQRLNNEPDFLIESENFFTEEKKPIYEESVLPIEEYGLPFQIAYDKNEPIDKNISADFLYTKQDLERLELSPDDFVKFFKNGTIFYKMNSFVTKDDISFNKIFKNGTKFSQQEIDPDEELIIKNSDINNLFNDKTTSIADIIKVSSEDDEKRESLKNKIFKLNQEIETRISYHNNFSISDEDTAAAILSRKKIEQKQEELSNKIFELKESFVNNNIFYRIQNLFFKTWDENNIYFGYKLENINFDVYSGDRIVVLSDDSITNQLLIDVLRGDEIKTSGYVYKNLFRKKQWIDVDDLKFNYSTLSDIDLNDELLYGLTSPDYLSFGLKKKDNVIMSMKKIFTSLGKTPNEKFLKKLINLMAFEPETTKNIFELDDLNLEKFITICDIAIDKKMILMKSICQGMSYNEKNALLNFLSDHFSKSNATVIYASDDLNDVNLFATKVMVLKKYQLMDFKPIDKILDSFQTVNDFVFYQLKYGKVSEMDEEEVNG